MGIFSRLKKIFHKSNNQGNISAEESTVAEKSTPIIEPAPSEKTPVAEPAEPHEQDIVKKPAIEIPYGDRLFTVHAVNFSKVPLTTSEDSLFTLTPINAHQEQYEWPEEENCVSVNTFGTRESNDSNWVGYIRSYNTQKLLGLVEEHETVNVHASVSIDNGDVAMALQVPNSLTPVKFNINEKYWIGFNVSRTRRLHNVNIVLLEPEGKRKPHVGIVGSDGTIYFEIQARAWQGYEGMKEMCGQEVKEVIVRHRKSKYNDGYYYSLEFDFEPPIDDWVI